MCVLLIKALALDDAEQCLRFILSLTHTATHTHRGHNIWQRTYVRLICRIHTNVLAGSLHWHGEVLHMGPSSAHVFYEMGHQIYTYNSKLCSLNLIRRGTTAQQCWYVIWYVTWDALLFCIKPLQYNLQKKLLIFSVDVSKLMHYVFLLFYYDKYASKLWLGHYSHYKYAKYCPSLMLFSCRASLYNRFNFG